MSEPTPLAWHPNVTIRQLHHFVVAAETGSLAEAGRVLRLAPSALSYSIDQLESALDVQLCVRRKAKGLALTPSGETVLAQARIILTDLRTLEHTFSRNDAESQGRIIVGSATPIAPLLLPTTQRTFVETYPEATVEFLEENQSVLQSRLLEGTIDLAFMYDLGIDHRIPKIPLFTLSPNVILPSSHPLAAADAPDTLTLEQLADDQFVLFGAEPMYDAYMRLFRTAGITPRVAHTCRSMGTLRAFVGRGIGLGLSYETYNLVKTVDDLEIISKPLRSTINDQVSVCIALPRDSRPSPLSRTWIAAAQSNFTR